MWWSRLLKIKQGQIQHFKIFLEKNFLKLGWKKFLYLMEKPIYLMKINFLTCPKNFLRLVWKTNLLKQKKIIHFFKERTNLMICVFPLFKKNFSYTQPTFVFFIFWEIFISFASIFLLFFLLVFLRKISIPFTSSFCSLSLFFGNI